MNFFENVTKQMEKKHDNAMKGVKGKVRSKLRSASDDEVRNLTYNGRDEVKELAWDEANRRGMSY